jgi:hypothetical protein
MKGETKNSGKMIIKKGKTPLRTHISRQEDKININSL